MSAKATIETEWFQTAAQADSTRILLDEFLANLKTRSFAVFREVVNTSDSNVSLESRLCSTV